MCSSPRPTVNASHKPNPYRQTAGRAAEWRPSQWRRVPYDPSERFPGTGRSSANGILPLLQRVSDLGGSQRMAASALMMEPDLVRP